MVVSQHSSDPILPMIQSKPEDLLVRPPDLPDGLTEGVFLVDKPKTWTSFDVVAKMRSILGVRKIGHAGTLDPMATGLLIVCVGRAATKQISEFVALEKEYAGTLRLGETTASYDADSEVSETRPWSSVTDAILEDAISRSVGDIQQVPPMFSAIKQGGERLYKKARRGETVKREPRNVTVFAWEVTDRRGPEVDFVVRCSKGTYIRSLAHDLGERLGCGAHLSALRRTQIGSFKVENAWSLAMLSDAKQRLKKLPQSGKMS